jgi:ferredoxin
MRVAIDAAKCSGHGRCYTLVSELFEDDDIGRGRPIGSGDVADSERDAALRAVRVCPEGAVFLVEDG